jgi:catechol 2,3-dioxygenase-like lactoylglutathione lyase family enzyme
MKLFDGSILLILILILAALSPCECFFLVARKSKGNVNVDTTTAQGRTGTPLGRCGGPIYASSSDPPLSQQPQQLQPPLQIHHTALKTRNITNAIEFYSLLGYQVASRFRAGPARAAWLELPQGNTADAPTTSATTTTTTTTPCTTTSAATSRLELLEVPAYMLPPSSSPTATRPPRAPNLMDRQEVLGYNHVALDVTYQIQHMQQQRRDQQKEQLDSVTIRNTNTTTAEASTSTATTSNISTSTTVSSPLADWMSILNTTSVERFGKTLRVALEPQQQIIGRGVYELAFLFDADGCLVELLHQQSVLPQSVNVQSGWEPWDGQGFVGLGIVDDK